MIEEKMSAKKYCRGNEQVREAEDKAVSFLENGLETILEH